MILGLLSCLKSLVFNIRRQHLPAEQTNEMPAGKEQNIARDRVNTIDHTNRPLAHPQVRIGVGCGSKSGQFAGSGGALQRTGRVILPVTPPLPHYA
jgi:hypothetical protein